MPRNHIVRCPDCPTAQEFHEFVSWTDANDWAETHHAATGHSVEKPIFKRGPLRRRPNPLQRRRR